MTMASIHISQLFEYVQMKKEFSIKWRAENGKVVEVEKAKLTSFFSSGDTMNIECADSKQIRSVNRLTIMEIDNMRVFI